MSTTEKSDPYIRYTHEFFRKWVPVYDLFASSIFYVYGKTVKYAKVNSGDSILDICTGTGEVARRCGGKGANVTGIDITPDMIEKARSKCARFDCQFKIMDARDLKFEDSTFDVSIISFALHDMPHSVRVKVLAEAIRVSRNRVVIVDYNFPHQNRLLFPLVKFIQWFESPYFRMYSQIGVKPLISEVNFTGPVEVKLIMPIFTVFILDLS